MKATFEIKYKDEKQAKDAFKILKAQEGKNTALHVLQGKTKDSIIYIIEADSFSPLRARSTSLLRDLKIVFNVFEQAGEKPRKDENLAKLPID